MPTYTPNQQRYIDAFLRQVDAVLDHFLKNGHGFEKERDSVGKVLDTALIAVDYLSNAATVAGAAAVVTTGGTILAPALAGLAVLKTTEEGVKFVLRHVGTQESPFSADEARQAEIRLSLFVLLREAAYLAVVRYRHFIDTVLEEPEIAKFARYGVARIIKKLATDLRSHVDLPAAYSAQPLVDYLMDSVHVSAIHEQQTVEIREKLRPPTSLWSPFLAYAKWGYARPRHVVVDKINQTTLQYTFYASPNEKMFLKKDTTLPEYGYITVPAPANQSKTNVITTQCLKPLQDSDITDKPQLLQDLCVYYLVTENDVREY